MRHLAVRRNRLRERAEPLRARAVGGDDVFVAEEIEHRQRGAACQRIAAVRMRMQKAACGVVMVERLVHRIGGENNR